MKRSTTLTTLALAGCGTGGQETGDGATETTAAETSTAASASPSGSAEAIAAEHDDADVMFAQMMLPHHQQAVDMSKILLAKDDVPAGVGVFAQGVIDAQGPEIQRMNAMLATWGQEPTGSESGGTDHGSMDHGPGMSGMMSEEDIQQLQDAQGAEAARLYLEQMTAHHRGAVEMAREEVADGRNRQAVALARQVIEDQEVEIQQMDQLLQELPDQS